MTPTFEQLWASTADLLHRVKKYDRHMAFSREISEISEAHRMLGVMKKMAGAEPMADRAVEKLKRMRQRLLTIMEDLLYTA
ncbi:hypothetical protein [Cohnella thermotolerans]|uniref:hypothetical protein n=1 Tax=Cohnella thermotolerans TaxID=329858 RepID=UPI0004270B22|nr:hypothetical protein [Cohnella thermotolerans]